ncbi:hypothetical protein WJ07_16870 [Burkholderia vietnamiensis]|nr:hypothetical protein WJ07_16870 [Burkholderia vietnamiensis]
MELRPNLICFGARPSVGRHFERTNKPLKLFGCAGQHGAHLIASLAFPIGFEPSLEQLALVAGQSVKQHSRDGLIGTKRTDDTFARPRSDGRPLWGLDPKQLDEAPLFSNEHRSSLIPCDHTRA